MSKVLKKVSESTRRISEERVFWAMGTARGKGSRQERDREIER